MPALSPSPANAEYQGEYLLFPYAEGSVLSGLAQDSQLDDNDNDFGINLFATIENQGFVFLGEALVAKDEQEVERLQFGWRLGANKIWLGRFHNPVGYWNNQFHHGLFLQQSISRPAVVEYEDDDGILPMHLSGLLVEGNRETGSSAVGYSFAVGAGPELGEHLEAVDILRPGSGSPGLAVAANLYRQPVAYGPSQYGVFAGYSEIPASERGIDEIRQVMAGGYWNWQSMPWRLLGSAYYVRNTLDLAAGSPSDDFLASYVQAEYAFASAWSLFGRAEKTFASDNDAYLALFPEFAREKLLVGVRFDFLERHAFTFEASTNRSIDDRYRQFTLQWSAMF